MNEVQNQEIKERLASKSAVRRPKKNPPTWGKIIGVTVIVSFLVSTMVGLVFGLAGSRVVGRYVGPAVEKYLSRLPAPNGAATIKTVREDSAVVEAVKKVSPAVVSIIITKDLSKIQTSDPFLNDPFFKQFFGQDFGAPQVTPPPSGTQKTEIGGGTGFIISTDGLIVTNRHVVEDTAADYTVLTNEGVKIPAKVVGRAQNTDLAVLKIDPASFYKDKNSGKVLPVVELGDSDSLEIGQSVIAIGNALGEFRNSVSVGVVSGLRRSITASGGAIGNVEQLSGVIQADAAINPGNSGGPLLNLEGQVIGINVAIAESAQNISFAIPINDVKKIISGVEKQGRIIQPFLGVRNVTIDKDLASKNGLPVDYGALIVRGNTYKDLAIIPGSPADKAGLMENDIILEVNGVKVDENNSLAGLISGYNVGDEVTLKILHRGQEKQIKAMLEERKS